MAPEEYLYRNLDTANISLSWLLPLLYVLLALTLVTWAGLRHSNRSRRGRALFVFTVGIVLILLASAFFLIRAVGSTQLVGVGTAATLLGCAMAVVAAGSLLPTIEDWFSGRRELQADRAAADRTRTAPTRYRYRRAPPRPVGVPGRRTAVADLRCAVPGGDRRAAARGHTGTRLRLDADTTAPTRSPISERPSVCAGRAGARVADWIYAGRDGERATELTTFPAWAGYVSRTATPTATGSSRSRGSTAT